MLFRQTLKIDKAALDINRQKLDANAISHIYAFLILDDFAFNGHIEQANPGSFLRSTRHQGVKRLANFRLQEEGCCRFVHLPFDFFGGVFLLGAVLRQYL